MNIIAIVMPKRGKERQTAQILVCFLTRALAPVDFFAMPSMRNGIGGTGEVGDLCANYPAAPIVAQSISSLQTRLAGVVTMMIWTAFRTQRIARKTKPTKIREKFRVDLLTTLSIQPKQKAAFVGVL